MCTVNATSSTATISIAIDVIAGPADEIAGVSALITALTAMIAVTTASAHAT